VERGILSALNSNIVKLQKSIEALDKKIQKQSKVMTRLTVAIIIISLIAMCFAGIQILIAIGFI